VLVADDSQADFIMLQAAFSEAGLPHRLVRARDGLQTIEYFEGLAPFSDRSQFPFPDLLILDINMPRAGGIEVLRFLLDHQNLRVPIVLLSGSVPPSTVEQALQLGASEYFDKPDVPRDLVPLVQTIHSRWLQ
jgi:CheY-like chemotaxis protein